MDRHDWRGIYEPAKPMKKEWQNIADSMSVEDVMHSIACCKNFCGLGCPDCRLAPITNCAHVLARLAGSFLWDLKERLDDEKQAKDKIVIPEQQPVNDSVDEIMKVVKNVLGKMGDDGDQV